MVRVQSSRLSNIKASEKSGAFWFLGGLIIVHINQHKTHVTTASRYRRIGNWGYWVSLYLNIPGIQTPIPLDACTVP